MTRISYLLYLLLPQFIRQSKGVSNQAYEELIGLNNYVEHTATTSPTLFRLGSDMGVPQVAQFRDGTTIRDIEFVLEKAGNYLSYLDEETRKECQNGHELCAYWALLGECDNNPSYMQEDCAPVCISCDPWTYEDRCPMPEDPEAENTWQKGDIGKLFKKLTSEPYRTKHSVEILSSPPDGPWIITMENIVTEDEAERWIELGQSYGYERSTEVGNVDDLDGTVEKDTNEGRTSTNAWCMGECLDEEVTINVSERLSDLTDIPLPNGEYIQLLRYEPGQFYSVHHDWIPHQIDRPYGSRILTVFLYLNDVESGGGTNFDKLNLTVQPKLGRALIWPSTLDDDPDWIDERTSHQALPVEAGIKYGANVWYHQRDVKAADAIGCLA